MLTIGLVFFIAQRGEPVVVKTNLENIPYALGAYIGTEDRFDDSIYKELNADRHVYRHYRSADGTQINLYIGYYGTAKGGRTGHNPYACLPGAGWGIVKNQKVAIEVSGKRETVNLVVAEMGNTYRTMLHWYQSDGDKVMVTGIQQNIQRLLLKIRHNRNDGAYVQVSMLSDRSGLDQAKMKTVQFAGQILQLLPAFWPEEK
ncbi:hypothetical protein DSCOOX_17220 [Desulfosarcina ovata subsp. ovata]|uniref:Methanolan biosynthesis EpsI domain-containing protein n=1 Tax=Desulfosarcina ovata subsp. ovata TaxID=2752305 RepID=A0A5K8A7F0_9BACT|nr:hypothetical protein DSCOOX_17220 [Desulfosarcina ovata subsp. ovata]